MKPRAAFVLLALPAFVLALLIFLLPERPARPRRTRCPERRVVANPATRAKG